MKTPLILNTDSYKVSHWMQYPEGTEEVFSYIESRGGKYKETIFFGLQMFIKKHLMTPVTMEDIDKAEDILNVHLGPSIFNRKGWEYIVKNHNGFLPVEIRAIPEGTVVPTKNALVTITNTDPECFWVTSYLETAMLRDVWYPTTVATISRECKNVVKRALEETSDDPGSIAFAVHSFGYRGVSSDESAQMGDLAHIISFNGTDTMASIVAGIEYYNLRMSEFPLSVIASEHSTMCANADAFLKVDFESAEKMVSILEKRCKDSGQFQIVAAVADTYDVFRFVGDYIGTRLKDRIMKSGGRLVVRPDSGDPSVIPVQLVEILLEKFGYETNSKGYKVLPSCIRVLQGDGINEVTIAEILENAKSKKIAADNFVFGMGGALLQHCDRDWQKFAMKCSAVKVNGVWREVYKDPITDPGKVSKKGRITAVRSWDNKIHTVKLEDKASSDVDIMQTVYKDGKMYNEITFTAVRENANK